MDRLYRPQGLRFPVPQPRRGIAPPVDEAVRRIVHRWVEDAGLESGSYGTHTMRRTKASLIYRRTRNLRAVQLLLGHTKLESTVRYLGIDVEDALGIAERTDV